MSSTMADPTTELLQDIRQLLITQGVGGPGTSPTPATLGRQAVEELNNYGGMSYVSDYIGSASADKFLSDDEMKALVKITFVNESELIKWFEPRMRAVMASVSQKLGHKMILLNSERHAWCRCMDPHPHLGAASKPDGVGLPVEMAALSMTPGDHQYANAGDINFGVLADWELRDSIEFICEWKEGNHALFGALGEAIEYARRIYSNFKSDCNVQETKQTMDMLVANQAGFQLVRCSRGTVRALIRGEWNSVGSHEALRRFMLGTLWQNVPRKRPWLEALELLTHNLGVELVEPSLNSGCFLGRGASGRVFRVRRKSDNRELAMKVALGTDGMARLAQESLKMLKHGRALHQAGVTVTLHKDKEYQSRQCGAILTGPVGMQMKPLKKHVKAALESLKKLSQVGGLAHGDARWPNAIICVTEDGSEKCLWIDLRTLEEHDGVEDQKELFVADVLELYDSFHCGARGDELEARICEYLVDDSSLEPLLDAMRLIWH
ncbi:MAG: hypothetical protein SGILL_008872 [Bacillariaceae sp.]